MRFYENGPSGAIASSILVFYFFNNMFMNLISCLQFIYTCSALQEFRAQTGALPRPGNIADADAVFDICRAMNESGSGFHFEVSISMTFLLQVLSLHHLMIFIYFFQYNYICREIFQNISLLSFASHFAAGD